MPSVLTVMAKSDSKKSSSTRDGGGGIPRPAGSSAITSSPSKLAIRSATSKVVTVNSSVAISQSVTTSKHDQLNRTASGDSKTHTNSEGPYKLHSAAIAYSHNQLKPLVNDKLYPRIPNPGPPMFHPSAPQRSQTLSLIPSHSSAKAKMQANSGQQMKAPNMPGSMQTRFGPPIGNDNGEMGVSRRPLPPQSQNSMPGPGSNSFGQQSIKGIMKASDRLPPAGSDIPPPLVSQPNTNSQVSVGISVSYPIPSSSQAHTSGPIYRPSGPLHVSSKQLEGGTSHNPLPHSSSYPTNSNPSLLSGPSQGQATHGQHSNTGSHLTDTGNGQLSAQGQLKIPPSHNTHIHQQHMRSQDSIHQQQILKSSGSSHVYQPGSSRMAQIKHPIPPASYHNGNFIIHNHPAHPTPPPYNQPPPPTSASSGVNDNANNQQPNTKSESEELSNHLASAKSELKRLASENNSIISDYSKKIAEQANEIRNLKELNARLSEDNQELRDLCCFLDDDRQKGRKLAREWQRFGRYTATVMRQEVSNYQGKLKDLDGKQHDLVRDNLELKELCLYLDEERTGAGVCKLCGGPGPELSPPPGVPREPRDEGDGSSSSTNNDDSETSSANLVEELDAVSMRERLYKESQKVGLNDEVLLYIRSLEECVSKLGSGSEFPIGFPENISTSTFSRGSIAESLQNVKKEGRDSPEQIGSQRPQSVNNAMKVLEVHEQLLDKSLDSSEETSDDLGDGEKALVREMCNVVWKKLEET